jgi:Flp pilus assembly protein TadG
MSLAATFFARRQSLRLRSLLSRFSRGRTGSTAVEFAMLALPFLGLLFGIIELGMIYLISTTLDNATTDAARQIRTGSVATSGGATASSFTTLVCNEMSWLGSNCAANLSVDVRTFSTFSSTSTSDPITSGTFNTGSLIFQTGNSGDIVLVRTYYPWTLVVPFLDGSVARLSNNKTLIESSTTFRNEPYS